MASDSQQGGGSVSPPPVRYMLVEAEPEKGERQKPRGNSGGSGPPSVGRSEPRRGGGGKGRVSSSGRRGGRGTGRGGRGRGAYYNMTPEEAKKMAAEHGAKQIEWYFSVHNLCSDVFMRSYMDEEGFIPIAFVANFPGVARLGADYPDIVEALTRSEVLEVDEENETMRLREGWGMWLLPNAHGGLGVPRYIKLSEEQAAELAAQQEQLAAAAAAEAAEGEGEAPAAEGDTPAADAGSKKDATNKAAAAAAAPTANGTAAPAEALNGSAPLPKPAAAVAAAGEEEATEPEQQEEAAAAAAAADASAGAVAAPAAVAEAAAAEAQVADVSGEVGVEEVPAAAAVGVGVGDTQEKLDQQIAELEAVVLGDDDDDALPDDE